MNEETKKNLIIYYSRTGYNYTNEGIKELEVGNTEVVAKMIQEIVGGDLFKVEPIQEYPNDYNECTNVAKEELKNNVRPELKKYLEDINDYGVIYVGYPNWWGTMPMPMFTQLEKLNLDEKVIMPFCTHEGSKMGNSEDDLKRICQNATVKRGLPIQGSNVKQSKEELEKWINNNL